MSTSKTFNGFADPDEIIAYMEGLTISEGPLVGQRFIALPWEREVIEAFVENRRIAFSIARSNGKTTVVAALACAALDPDGPLHIPRGYIQLNASSLDQAAVNFTHIKYFLGHKLFDPTTGKLRKGWRVADNHHYKSIEHIASGAKLQALGSDKKRAHGRAPSFAVCDEPAQWQGGSEGLVVAIRTGMGKQPNARLFCIGTRPEDDSHWFSQMLDSPDRFTWTKTYRAEIEDVEKDPFSSDVIRAANPSIDHMPTVMEEIEAAIEAARTTGGTALASYKALHLNMGTPEVAEREMIIDIDVWRGLVLTSTPAPRDGPVSIGIDLGGGTSMCAVAFYWPVTGRLETYGAFPAKPSLAERGRRDGVGDRYERMLERGEITVCGVWETDSVSFLQDRLGDIEDYEWLSIEADNYAKTKVKQAMHGLGRDVESISFRRVGRGPEGKEDVEAFQSEVNTGHLSVGRNILLDSAIASSKLVRDTNGNPALRKDKHKGRIDPLQATLLAVGEGQRWRKPPGEDVMDPEAMVA